MRWMIIVTLIAGGPGISTLVMPAHAAGCLQGAVIGGVVVGTMTTLLFVPYLYSVIGRFERRRADLPQSLLQHRAST